jgi:hypothetical protein
MVFKVTLDPYSKSIHTRAMYGIQVLTSSLMNLTKPHEGGNWKEPGFNAVLTPFAPPE